MSAEQDWSATSQVTPERIVEAVVGAGLVKGPDGADGAVLMGQGIEVRVLEDGGLTHVRARSIRRDDEELGPEAFDDWIAAIEPELQSADPALAVAGASGDLPTLARLPAVEDTTGVGAAPAGAPPPPGRPAPPSGSGPGSTAGGHPSGRLLSGWAVPLILALGVSAAVVAISALSTASLGTFLLHGFFPVLAGYSRVGFLGGAMAVVAGLCLFALIAMAARSAAARYLAAIAAAIYLGSVLVGAFIIGLQIEWGRVSTIGGLYPFGSGLTYDSGPYPATLLFGVVAIAVLLLGVIGSTARTGAGTQTPASASTQSGSGGVVAAALVVLVATVGLGYALTKAEIDKTGFGSLASGSSGYSGSTGSTYGSGGSYGSGSSSGSSGSYGSGSSSSSAGSSLPARLQSFASSVSCSGAPAGSVAVEYYETSKTRITICLTTSGSYYWVESGVRGAQAFTVSKTTNGYASLGEEHTYQVGPDAASWSSMQQPLTIEAVSRTSAAAATATVDVLSRLADLMETSSRGRDMVRSLSGNLGSSCSVSGSEAQSTIAAINANRRAMLDAATSLRAQVASTQAPVAQFQTAMDESLQADLAWSEWIDSEWVPYAASGCSGPITRDGDPSWDAFLAHSGAATAAKRTLVALYNPLAANVGLRSDWQEIDV